MGIGFRLNWRALFAGCALLLGSVAAQAAEVASAASIPGHEMTLNGVRYHVGDQGTGERVVLLLHGMPDTSAVWRHQVKALVDAAKAAVGRHGSSFAILTSSGARFFMRHILEDQFPGITVLSHSEIPPGARVIVLGSFGGAN